MIITILKKSTWLKMHFGLLSTIRRVKIDAYADINFRFIPQLSNLHILILQKCKLSQ